MTVSTEISSNEYTGNGVTTDFDYKFRIFKANQLSVITSDADGDNVVTLRLGTDYTVTGANKSTGGKVVLTKPLANGHKISIARDIPITQETSFRNQGKFLAETHEDAFDYLTMIVQRIWGSLGSLYLKRPNILANWFDAKGYRIANLGKPKRDSDAVDLGTLKDEISGVNSTILKCEKRLLRVDDMDIEVLPKASDRAGNVLTFDKDGKPILVAPASGSAVDVFNKLAGIDGLAFIGSTNYQGIRYYYGDKNMISVYGRDHIFDGCNGEFTLDESDKSSPDDGGTVLIDALNRRWKRVINDSVYLHWFVKNDGIALANEAFRIADKVCSNLKRTLVLQGDFFVNEPIVMHRSASENSGLYVIEGAGDSTTIIGEINEPGRSILEITGESNPLSNKKSISNFRLRMKGGSGKAYCLKVGDVKESFKAEKIICHGANGLLLKTGLASWAQMGTVFSQCSFRSNYGEEWYKEEEAEVFSVYYDGNGAKWDNVMFLSCQFAGLVEPRASVVEYALCNFLTNARRPTTTRNFANNIAIRIGSASIRGCYFEDHKVAIEIRPTNNIVNQVTITGCRFSGFSNTSNEKSELAIEIAGTNNFGSVNITDCYFADTDAEGEAIYQKGSIRLANAKGFVNIDRVSNYYSPNVPIRILKESQNFAIGNNGRKASSKSCIYFMRSGMRDTGIRTLNFMGMDGITDYTDKIHDYYINGITASFSSEPSGNVRIRLMLNGELIRELTKSSFNIIDNIKHIWSYTSEIPKTITSSDNLSINIITDGQTTGELSAVLKLDVCY
ncbi:hypothetical protein M0L22_RS02840 [Providencia rettgeri]|nr:hypothetical protein [Providencia rettgeri]